MRCNARPLGVLAAVAKGLLILCTVPTNASRSSQASYLQQTHSLVRHMAEDAQELFAFYESNQSLNVNNICQSNKWVEWLPQWDVADLQAPSALQELYGAMEHMHQALQTILQHQRDLNAPGAKLLQRLTSTHLKVRGLLNNIEALLRAHGVVPVHITLPEKPVVTKVFQQKLEGCKVLWSYSRFMSKLNADLEAKGFRDCREKRRQRRGSRRGPRANKKVRRS
ncbi:leukemia inhibitory factor-like [Apteryx mantelli]|uniref:Ciliary neurotrophic factor n=1 Tax=Apteryx mantelli TaxID=2696672 RepID=A0ABM4FEQ7_9AVES